MWLQIQSLCLCLKTCLPVQLTHTLLDDFIFRFLKQGFYLQYEKSVQQLIRVLALGKNQIRPVCFGCALRPTKFTKLFSTRARRHTSYIVNKPCSLLVENSALVAARIVFVRFIGVSSSLKSRK